MAEGAETFSPPSSQAGEAPVEAVPRGAKPNGSAPCWMIDRRPLSFGPPQGAGLGAWRPMGREAWGASRLPVVPRGERRQERPRLHPGPGAAPGHPAAGNGAAAPGAGPAQLLCRLRGGRRAKASPREAVSGAWEQELRRGRGGGRARPFSSRGRARRLASGPCGGRRRSEERGCLWQRGAARAAGEGRDCGCMFR